jgi:aryl-alcohol dehydrogenase-like predicted oxidoreductase
MAIARDFPLRLGFGCSGAWGQKWFAEREAAALVARALEGGVRHFDTAGFYADGEAERRLGAALKAVRAAPFVSTKTGTRYVPGRRPLKDFSEAGMRRDVEQSLRRLHRERLDLLYLHGPNAAEIDAARPALERLVAEGKIAGWGVCGEGAPLLDHAVSAGAGAVMAVYNLLRLDHAAPFARAHAQGALTVAIAPLAQGLYARGFFQVVTAADAWRVARALIKNRPELATARRLRKALESFEDRTAAGAALGFVQANPHIAVAMTTTTKPSHLDETLRAAGRPLSADEAALLAAAALDARRSGA